MLVATDRGRILDTIQNCLWPCWGEREEDKGRWVGFLVYQLQPGGDNDLSNIWEEKKSRKN